MKYFLLPLCFCFLFGKEQPQYIDGVAAVVEEHIILKSDLAQMVNMAAVQSGIDPSKDQSFFLRLQNSVLQSMVDQKILLEMADIDSITVEEKEVDQSLEQQIQMLVAQAGGEKRAEEILGQSLSDFRREFWFDMRDRLVSFIIKSNIIIGNRYFRSDDAFNKRSNNEFSIVRIPFSL